ncbi:PSD1 and planctomycete cytochrome C domain-containing protein [Reichenbachiella sp. MALMAid0571]|uniref:PSD1 and planctomycete cytochrome C domain-containing protein n=1 Tax=Reichenbachiella sp. MALMAid0571 TaxID=3143939 RepID=UPI0032DE2E00
MKKAISILAVIIFCIGMFQCKESGTAVKVPKNVDFNFDIRPILVQNCYLCHGPDPSSRKADLRLDTFEGATAQREEGNPAIVPGNISKSEMIKRITHHDADAMMPPPESNLKLSEYEIEVLKKWIDQGAEWKVHWAFNQPEYKEAEKHDTDEAVNEIDNYILEKLENKGLSPAPLANKNTLIRRVSYILTGLPPTPDELSQFLADDSPDAYEKMVDQYLESGAFGERWARHWMDIVRYAETKGHEFDFPIIGAWQYRDYLIRAFNEDIPYDQLVREHLAGDLLDSVRWNPESGINESRLGTAFYALGEGTHSPVDIRKDEADRIDNMIDVTTKTFQGLTVSCARCHDHKFDPIPTADYYALYGVMESSRFSLNPSNLTYDKVKSLEEIEGLKNGIRNLIAENWPTDDLVLSDSPATTEKPQEESEWNYKVLGDFRGQDLNDWKSDGLAFGTKTTLGKPEFNTEGNKLVRLASGAASSRQLSKGVYGALRSPNFVIDTDFIGVHALGEKAMIRIIIDNFQLIRYPIYGGLEKKINTQEWKKYSFDVSPWKGHKAYIEILPGEYNGHHYKLEEDAFIDVEYVIAYDGEWPEQIKNTGNSKENESFDDWVSGKASTQLVENINYLIKNKKLNNKFEDANNLLEQYQQLTENLKDSTFFIGINEGFGIDSHVFNRGNYQDLSEDPVPRGFLSVLPVNKEPVKSNGSGRLEVAQQILDKENPLTSRVMINRVWHHLFGKGIVTTVDNFGLQGKLPTHPELLDYLAIKFQNEGWSVKSMVKYIVMSNTFRRSTVSSEENVAKLDPTNALLSHFPIRRLESEAIWDGLLSISGNLNSEMYGEPVPVYLTDFMQGRGRPGKSGPLDGNGRRSIYQAVRRNFLQPMMLTFDRPIPFSTFGNRNVTNVPAQSLILMNDPFIVHQAEVMAKEVLNHEKLSQTDRLKYIYIKTLSREPTKEEIDQANTFIQILAESYELKEEDAATNIDVWKDYCHSVFNLKEFIYLI